MSIDSLAPLLDRLDRLAALLEARHPAASAAPLLPGGHSVVWEPGTGFRAVRRPATVDPGLLIGVDRQKERFFANVDRYLRGRPAHDVLLWGDRGTGKSSLVRALLARFQGTGLALLELPETAVPDLPKILDAVHADSRRWVLYLDDLTFRGGDAHYRELKVLLEGGLESRPPNTLVVVTSNRRHLVPESFPGDHEVHPEETVAEQTSLADRFGLSLGFYPFDEATYLDAVRRHLVALGAVPSDSGWQARALRWAMTRGIRSGRTALQAAREIAAGD